MEQKDLAGDRRIEQSMREVLPLKMEGCSLVLLGRGGTCAPTKVQSYGLIYFAEFSGE